MENPNNLEFRKTLDTAFRHALSHLEKLDQTSVAATAELDTLRAQIVKPLGREGLASDQVVDELVRDVAGGLLGSAGGRFFGWVIGGALPAAECPTNFSLSSIVVSEQLRRKDSFLEAIDKLKFVGQWPICGIGGICGLNV